MATQKETKFKIKARARLNEIPETYVTKIQQVAIRGIPDFLICHRGLFFAWELKTNTGVASALQEYNLNAISKAGGVSRIVTPDNLDDSIKEMLDAGNNAHKGVQSK